MELEKSSVKREALMESTPSPSDAGARSALRQKYETEAKDILQRLGGIEAVRHKLGLSQRAMAQALLVDPSAWTRWVKGITPVPPYVARILELFLLSLERHPELNVDSLLHNRQVQAQTLRQILQTQEKLRALEKNHLNLHSSNQKTSLVTDELDVRLNAVIAEYEGRSRRLVFALLFLSAMNFGLLIYLWLR